MTNFKISFVDKIPKEIEEKMEKGLSEYALTHGVEVNYTSVAFLLSDVKHQVIGVLDAFSSYSCIHIRDLWVDKAFRGKGYGKKLIAELEKYCKDKGFNNINLITCAFQAPEFYKKCGYKVEFIRENIKNPKLTMTFLIKYVD